MRGTRFAIVTALALSSAGCTSLDGYPNDPQQDGSLNDLRDKYFSSSVDDCYKASGGGGACLGVTGKQAIRDDVVLNRMHVYDMEFSQFVRALSAGNNSVSLGSDLTAFTLNGLAATTGNAATKAALAAASTGILAANGAVDKDLFYQKTIPALVAQMSADRAKAAATLIAGLQLPDDQYPLPRAVLDLDALNRAGGINGAVANITNQATDQKKIAEDLVAPYRSLAFSDDSNGQTIRTWLAADRDAHTAKLNAWLKANAPDNMKDVALFVLVSGTGDDLNALRKKIVADPSLGISK